MLMQGVTLVGVFVMRENAVDISGKGTIATPSSPSREEIKMGPVPSEEECRTLRRQIVDEIYSRMEEHGY